MKEKIAYLRGLIDGLKIADDDNGKVIRAIVVCLDALADEIERNTAADSLIEDDVAELKVMVADNDDILDEVVSCLLGEDCEDQDDECEWDDEFNYFTCPNCGETVILDDAAIENEASPICPKCNKPIFGEDEK